jgi:hypothetical protein
LVSLLSSQGRAVLPKIDQHMFTTGKMQRTSYLSPEPG